MFFLPLWWFSSSSFKFQLIWRISSESEASHEGLEAVIKGSFTRQTKKDKFTKRLNFEFCHGETLGY
jgi:hypothetical protein